MADYKDKIQKLLSLAESPNEFEAKAALLKARELMAQHKLTEADFKDKKDREVKHVMTDITFSSRRRMWYSDLARVVADNNCCHFYVKHQKGKQTMTVCFVGLDDDVDICKVTYEYALEAALSEVRKIEKQYKGFENIVIKSAVDAYGEGFASGLQNEYEKQFEENKEKGWGLVVVTPQEVIDATSAFGQKKLHAQRKLHMPDEYAKGYEDGQNFKPQERIAEAV